MPRSEGDHRWKAIGIGKVEFHYLPWKYLPLSNKILTIAGLAIIGLSILMMLR